MRWPRPPRSFRQQIVVLTATVTAFAMLLLTIAVQLLLAHVTSNDVDRVLQDRADAVISSVEAADGGGIDVPDSQLDPGVAVYDDQGALVAGSVPDQLERTYRELSTTDTRTYQQAGDLSRVLAEPFTTPDGATGVVVVAERLEPYEEAERLALIVSLVTGVLATIAAAVIAAWTTRRALRPVAVMAETATEWSEHDLGRRFDLGPPDNEISALASTLDTLLDKVSSAIRSEQRLTSELAHELRTPLTTIQGVADLMLLRDVLPPDAARDLEEISAASQRMAATITALLELARNEASVVASSHCSLAEVLAEVTQGLDAGDTELTVPTSDVLLDLPHALAVRALSPVVENAFRYARSRVTVSFQPAAAGMVQVLVDDDGPGVDADRTSLIFEPGTTSGTSAGAGLGLAIARRIARSVGGDVEVAPDAPVTRFVITLPRA